MSNNKTNSKPKINNTNNNSNTSNTNTPKNNSTPKAVSKGAQSKAKRQVDDIIILDDNVSEKNIKTNNDTSVGKKTKGESEKVSEENLKRSPSPKDSSEPSEENLEQLKISFEAIKEFVTDLKDTFKGPPNSPLTLYHRLTQHVKKDDKATAYDKFVGGFKVFFINYEKCLK